MFNSKKLNIAFCIIFIFIIIYVLFLLLLHLIDYRLTNVEINLPKQITNQNNSNIENFDNSKNDNLKNNKNINENNISDINGYSKNENTIYGNYSDNKNANIIIDDSYNKVCCINHNHDKYKCTYGTTNFPNPNNMNQIDKRLFKNNYQENMSLQDYINWLYLYENDTENLSYEHHKFLDELKYNKKLTYIKGICPPPARKINKSNNSIEYYQNLYNNIDNSDFTKLINESPIKKIIDYTKDEKDIKNASNIHSKQINGYNYMTYTRLNEFNKIN